MPNTAIAEFTGWLKERCEFLHNLEREADRILHEDNNSEKYKTMMCQKAMFLQALPEEAEKRVACLPRDVADTVMERIDGFAANASRALTLDSVFYMSALLYPDDHREGQPNALDVLAAEMAALAGK